MPRANPKPLEIAVIGDSLFFSDELKVLEEKGHYVAGVDPEKADVVIGPRCWRIDPALGHLDKQLQMMVEGVRNIKYPKKKEDGGVKTK